ELAVHGNTAGAVEQCRRVAAVHRAERVVDGAVGRSFEHRMTAIDLDQGEAERFTHRRLPGSSRHQGAKLLEAVERAVSPRAHGPHHGSWNGRTSARNDQASRG